MQGHCSSSTGNNEFMQQHVDDADEYKPPGATSPQGTPNSRHQPKRVSAADESSSSSAMMGEVSALEWGDASSGVEGEGTAASARGLEATQAPWSVSFLVSCKRQQSQQEKEEQQQQQEIRVDASFDGTCLSVSFCCPFWLLNLTSLPLEYRPSLPPEAPHSPPIYLPPCRRSSSAQVSEEGGNSAERSWTSLGPLGIWGSSPALTCVSHPSFSLRMKGTRRFSHEILLRNTGSGTAPFAAPFAAAGAARGTAAPPPELIQLPQGGHILVEAVGLPPGFGRGTLVVLKPRLVSKEGLLSVCSYLSLASLLCLFASLSLPAGSLPPQAVALAPLSAFCQSLSCVITLSLYSSPFTALVVSVNLSFSAVSPFRSFCMSSLLPETALCLFCCECSFATGAAECLPLPVAAEACGVCGQLSAVSRP